VRVAGVFDSSSTEAGSERLYLFRQHAGQLSLMFDAKTEDSVTDKTSNAPADSHAWIVRFGTALHHGAYDLFLQPERPQASRRFVWSGSAYGAADSRD